jgi:hypothetical protein
VNLFISNAPLPTLLETSACGFQSLIQAKMCDRYLSSVDSDEPQKMKRKEKKQKTMSTKSCWVIMKLPCWFFH